MTIEGHIRCDIEIVENDRRARVHPAILIGPSYFYFVHDGNRRNGGYASLLNTVGIPRRVFADVLAQRPRELRNSAKNAWKSPQITPCAKNSQSQRERCTPRGKNHPRCVPPLLSYFCVLLPQLREKRIYGYIDKTFRAVNATRTGRRSEPIKITLNAITIYKS